MSKAISRRPQFLEYRKSHHGRIANYDTSNIPETTETVVSSLPTVAKQDPFPQGEAYNDLEDGVSVTSYAETVFGDDALCTPKIPETAKNGEIFQCPYCFLIIGDINNKLQWKRHVFNDLQPYICIYPECISADDFFAST
ncbi:hypothetical protein DM02DRAFT_653603 [Periconia macrospinosa]|uniref:Oxidoreductase acuF-like C2H2 type zinc-finger domain-containing protein n=1 Tax=Periconia macrospinosa TaxID=97972 RepID=A0A2V1DVV8_9PLEO|nr:hypothetical protein DM02DRAFT_653603 [Periconia macrospinosa]